MLPDVAHRWLGRALAGVGALLAGCAASAVLPDASDPPFRFPVRELEELPAPASILPLGISLRPRLFEALADSLNEFRSLYGHGKIGAAEIEWLPEPATESIEIRPPYIEEHLTLRGRLRVRSGSQRCESDSFGARFTVQTRPILLGFSNKPGTFYPSYRNESDDSQDGVTRMGQVSQHAVDQWMYRDRGMRLIGPEVKIEQVGELTCEVPGIDIKALHAEFLAPIEENLSRNGRLVVGLAQLADDFDAQFGSYESPQGHAPSCLETYPSAIVLSPANPGETDVLRLGIEISSYVTAGRCSVADYRPPGLQLRTTPISDEAHVQGQFHVPASAIQGHLLRQLLGRALGEGAFLLRVERVVVIGLQGRLLIRLIVSGRAPEDLYFWGTPTLVREGDRYTLQMPDLQLAEQSWLRVARYRLPHGAAEGWTQRVQDAVRMDVTESVVQLLRGLDPETPRMRIWNDRDQRLRRESGQTGTPQGPQLGGFQLPQPLRVEVTESGVLRKHELRIHVMFSGSLKTHPQ